MKRLLCLLLALPFACCAQNAGERIFYTVDTVRNISIANAVGQILYTQNCNNANLSVRLKELVNGLYTITINGIEHYRYYSNGDLNFTVIRGTAVYGIL